MNLNSLIIFILCYNISYVWTNAIEITSENIDSILSSNEIVFINFYVNWCKFSQIINPIYDQLADKITKQYSQKNLIVIGKVDCDNQSSISIKYHINKYPTLKLFRHGILTKREYRGAREINSLFKYVKEQIESSIINLTNINDLKQFDSIKYLIIGHFQNVNSSNYNIFSKIANLLKDDCQFAASINKDDFKIDDDIIYYRSNETKEYYNGLISNHQSLYAWINEKCIPLVREITFLNAEQLTDEGLPFLILFHHINDYKSIQLFQHEINKQLIHERSNINCLHADGFKFNYPLKHLGKTISDLPLLVIDNFQHMFTFPDFKQISVKKNLLKFVKDFHSGKLHQDFHNSTTQKINHEENRDNKLISPPQSVFIHLTPNRQRYSFRDEL